MTISYKDVGLFEHEYHALKEHVKREPTETELYLAGVMWSEHCSYKSTRPLLKQFPKAGKYVLGGEGENAGVVDLGSGYGLVFKVESHNHPSAVEPYQGAATGVGGIIRDILAMGARPVAVMDGLCFGEENHKETLRIKSPVVHGVGGYGNCVGVPNIGGKTLHHPCFNHNPLVNAFCAGVVKLEQMVSAKTATPGSVIMVLGAATGRDGIAGAAFASVELDQDNRDDRPRIQVGDPFAEKQLIECFLELNERGLITAAQDMGAAGVISSSSEVAAVSAVGMKIHLDHVHTREQGMTGWEIALSESQERFLLIVDESNVETITQIAHKWELNTSVIGKCYGDEKFELYDHGTLVADVAPDIIGGNAPIIPWQSKEPEDYNLRQIIKFDQQLDDLKAPLLELLASASLRSHHNLYQQYDGMVQTNTIQGAGAQVGIIRVEPADVAVGFAMEVDPIKCYVHPKNGAAGVVCASIRALSIAGFEPMALTDGINHPSPEKPEQFWELSQNIAGMVEACDRLQCPVVSGNVSLYNESPHGRILPSPFVVTVGIKPLGDPYLNEWDMEKGDAIYLVGETYGSMGGSHYAALYDDFAAGEIKDLDWAKEQQFMDMARHIAKNQLARSGKQIMGGGLLTTLAKICIHNNLGCDISSSNDDALRFYFGESGPRTLYVVPQDKRTAFEAALDIDYLLLGTAGGDKLLDVSIETLRSAYHKGL